MNKPPAFRIRERSGFRWLQFRPLDEIGGTEHGFSLRDDRFLGRISSSPFLFLKEMDVVRCQSAALTNQVHGAEVAVVDRPGKTGGADGLLTDRPGLLLVGFAADCLLVFLADPVRRAVGIVHAGRRGTELGIAAAAMGRMAETFGSDPSSCRAFFSPGIEPCCYELDLVEENRRQLEKLGLKKVEAAGLCTKCRAELFYSWRRGDREKRMVGWIGISVKEVVSPDT